MRCKYYAKGAKMAQYFYIVCIPIEFASVHQFGSFFNLILPMTKLPCYPFLNVWTLLAYCCLYTQIYSHFQYALLTFPLRHFKGNNLQCVVVVSRGLEACVFVILWMCRGSCSKCQSSRVAGRPGSGFPCLKCVHGSVEAQLGLIVAWIQSER